MRVIAGEYGGRKLKSLAGDNTRPTTDKVKESIFNIIGPYFDGGQVLDLFSGSGSLAIEAISRGMCHAVCVDKHFGAIKVMTENIAITKEPEKFSVKKLDANLAIKLLATEKFQFDLVLLDPPYASQKIIQQIEEMLALDLLQDDCLIVCETDRTVGLPADVPGFQLRRRQVYGATEVVIYERSGE